jgi:hypothetical protein
MVFENMTFVELSLALIKKAHFSKPSNVSNDNRGWWRVVSIDGLL